MAMYSCISPYFLKRKYLSYIPTNMVTLALTDPRMINYLGEQFEDCKITKAPKLKMVKDYHLHILTYEVNALKITLLITQIILSEHKPAREIDLIEVVVEIFNCPTKKVARIIVSPLRFNPRRVK
ncbi:hypothetical protein ACTXT7_005950 [Hymenolepis weldensis]